MGSNDGKNEESGLSSATKAQTGERSKGETHRRRISPYDLSSSDNPGSVISQPLLSGPNYNEWAGNLRMALKARKKFGFVDGTIPLPGEDSEDLEDWWTNNALEVSWIKLTITEKVRSNLSHIEIASDYWEHIRRRYSVKNGQRVQRIKAELAMCRQQGTSIEEYYGKLKKLWTSLAEFRQTKACTCPAGINLEKEREEDKLHEFLKGLDESLYGSVKSNFLSRKPLPSLDEAYSALLQDKDSKHTSRVLNDTAETMACAARTSTNSGAARSYPSREERSNLHCSSCGKKGHTSESCFRKIGYPEWWPDKPKGRVSSGHGRGTGSPQAGSETQRVNSVHAQVAAQHSANTIVAADRVVLTGLDDDQWKMLVTLLNERKQTDLSSSLTGISLGNSWIVDSGATNHMTCSLEFLSNVREISVVPVKLPDGRFSYASKQGTLVVSSVLSLQNVLLVDGLHCHLISVSQLNQEQQSVFQITDKLCLIQDRITRTLIGVADMEN